MGGEYGQGHSAQLLDESQARQAGKAGTGHHASLSQGFPALLLLPSFRSGNKIDTLWTKGSQMWVSPNLGPILAGQLLKLGLSVREI